MYSACEKHEVYCFSSLHIEKHKDESDELSSFYHTEIWWSTYGTVTYKGLFCFDIEGGTQTFNTHKYAYMKIPLTECWDKNQYINQPVSVESQSRYCKTLPVILGLSTKVPSFYFNLREMESPSKRFPKYTRFTASLLHSLYRETYFCCHFSFLQDE